MTVDQTQTLMQSLCKNISLVIKGKEEKINLLIQGIIAGGHILLEDIPGVGKTTLARALAKSVDASFNRIQFTPDLLPTDITGINLFSQNDSQFHFKPGPVFANILLADEINRASPRTQSALLEAMSDEQISVDGESHPLPQPFIVLATQNPIEYHGTYPLPEAQLDRFMLQLDLGYPPANEEKNLLINRTNIDPIETISPVISIADLMQLRAMIDTVVLDESISHYIMQIIDATRHHSELKLGVSTRGALLYSRIVRARALFHQRDYVIPEDVKELASSVLAHRVIQKNNSQSSSFSQHQLITDIVSSIEVPR